MRVGAGLASSHPPYSAAPTPSRASKAKIGRRQGCWIWSGSIDTSGYGSFFAHGRMVSAHRFSYEAFIGAIPAGMHLDHLCRHRDCVNPTHLEVVTQQENIRRGLHAFHGNGTCQSGRHDITEPSNVKQRANGDRQCRACLNESKRRSYWRQKEEGLR